MKTAIALKDNQLAEEAAVMNSPISVVKRSLASVGLEFSQSASMAGKSTVQSSPFFLALP